MPVSDSVPSLLDARHALLQQQASTKRARLLELLQVVIAPDKQTLTLAQMVELIDLVQEDVVVPDLYAWASGLRAALKQAMEPYDELVDAILDGAHSAVPQLQYTSGHEYRLPSQAGFVPALVAIGHTHAQQMADRIVNELEQQGAAFLASPRGMSYAGAMQAFVEDFAAFDARCATMQTVDEACSLMEYAITCKPYESALHRHCFAHVHKLTQALDTQETA
jgi:hypothetical protein